MATEDRTTEGAEASPPETNGSGKAPTGVDALKARVAAKRGAAGKQEMIAAASAAEPGPASTAVENGGPSADTPTAIPADAGVPDNEITPAAKDELARLASIRAGESGVSGDTSDGSSEAEAAEDDPEKAVMEGLQAEGGSLYEKRQAEIAAAKARSGGKASGKGLKAKVKETAKAKKEKEKAKLREKTEKQKEKEAEKKAKAKAAAEERKAKEKERKEKQAALKRERAAERAAKRVPDIMAKESKAMQAAFAEDYAIAGPKTDRNPNGIGLRRAKADRGDVAAGYIMAMRRIRRAQQEGAAA